MDHTKFSEAEWEACIKVLTALKDAPFDNPDNSTFSGLISKISKQAKKQNRKESYTGKRAHDLELKLGSQLAQQALKGHTSYSELLPQQNEFKQAHIPVNCYCCNRSYTQLHSFYNRLCPECATENYERRFVTIDLKGRNVLLTGGRVKIGFATALKILRNGANLTVTTRFPASALELFRQEPDYAEWADRLWVYGLDLRNLKAIAEFVNDFRARFDTLDILINNAAQTIQYDNDYYRPLIQNEQTLLGKHAGHPRLTGNQTRVTEDLGLLNSTEHTYTDVALTRFGQPVDLREHTSWNAVLEEISLFELLEVNLINQIAPYYLIKELKPMMEASAFKEKFIINVTSSEGNFNYENKTIFHPHTNMTKAALNMLTLTSARAFADQHIYMSAVDVGWVSTGARETLRQQQFEKGYIPPLDSVDGAARILQPIAEGIHGMPIFGKLLKNYRVHPW